MTKYFFQKVFDAFSFFTVAQITVISFICISLIGGIILYLTESNRIVNAKIPIERQVIISERINKDDSLSENTRQETHIFTKDIKYQGEHFIDAIFTAVSAVCVTGLTSTDFSTFTLPGQITVLILIQIGGLGIIVATSILAMIFARGISGHISFQKLLSGILDTEANYVRDMIKHIVLYTFTFELVGTLIMGTYLQVSHAQTLINGINPWWWALFHAISAFNNAGFGLLNNNLVNFVTDPVINFTIAFLIILGGLGYPVLISIHVFFRKYVLLRKNKKSRLFINMHLVKSSPVQMHVAIAGTIVLILIGTIFPFFETYHQTIFDAYTLQQQILISFFQSVSTRTAGFNTIDIGTLGSATMILYMILMFIGANPAGTAGGIKIPTVAVLYGYVKDWLSNPGKPVMLMKKPVSKFAVSHAIRLFFMSIITIAILDLLICFVEEDKLITPDPTFNFLKILFEVVSAFSTVGLSAGFTNGVTSFSALLEPISKLFIIMAMLIGRLGPLTVFAALTWKKEPCKEERTEDYPNAQKIEIG